VSSSDGSVVFLGAFERVKINGLALCELHDRLLPGAASAHRPADPLGLAGDHHGIHTVDLDAEELLHGAFDLRLGRVVLHPKRHLILHFGELSALLGHHRTKDGFIWCSHRFSTSWIWSSAFRLSTSAS